MKRYDLNKSHGVPYDWHLDPAAYTEPDAPWVHETDVDALKALLAEALKTPGWVAVARLAADNARLRAALYGLFDADLEHLMLGEGKHDHLDALRIAREALEVKP